VSEKLRGQDSFNALAHLSPGCFCMLNRLFGYEFTKMFMPVLFFLCHNQFLAPKFTVKIIPQRWMRVKPEYILSS
jgi:hypothetical protein